MFARQDRGGWIADNSDTYDIDEVYTSLQSLIVYTESTADAVWHYLVEYDSEEVRKTREYQKMELARYAGQSLLQWDDVEVCEISRMHGVLRDVISNENPVQTMVENS